MRLPSSREAARGQILIVAVVALVAIVGMVGLVIDGGALFAQQRIAQNGADAASTAGAVVIAEYMGGATRTNQNVYDAVAASALANDLAGWTAEYTDDFGDPLSPPVNVTPGAGGIPTNGEGVRATGTRNVSTTFSRIFGFDQIPATAEATVVAGPLSAGCVADEDGCTVLPVTFPVQVSACDTAGELIPGSGTWIGAPPPGASPGAPYWELVGANSLPSATDADGDPNKMAILPFCRSASGGSGAFGKLDLAPGMNFPQEITGPINVTINLPDWFQTQPGNVASVDGELSAWIHKPVLLPLNNGACRVDPGVVATCPAGQAGVDPVGNNTWYYVHTLAVFYIHEVDIQGAEGQECDNAPGSPPVPDVNGVGFLGCIKGWFVNYVTAGPIIPGQTTIPGTTAIGIQLIK